MREEKVIDMKDCQMTEKDREFTGGEKMGKIIQALHLIHDYVQKDENGNIESKNRVLREKKSMGGIHFIINTDGLFHFFGFIVL